MNKRYILNLVVAFIGGAGMLAGSAQASPGGDMQGLIDDCNSCHGKKGVSSEPDIPTIAGLSDFFIDDTLLIYLDEARPCVEAEYQAGPKKGEKTDMCQIAAELSEEQRVALAEHYSSLPFVPADQPFDAAKVELGASIHDRNCEKCHAEGGSDPMDDSGLLAGQWSEYLRHSIGHFRAGERDTDEKMIEKLEALSDEEIDALINYYASLQDKYGN